MGDGDDFTAAARGERVEDASTIGGIGDGVGADDGDGRTHAHHDVGVVDRSTSSVEGFKRNRREIFGGAVLGDDFLVRAFGKRDVRDAFFVVDHERSRAFEKLWRVLTLVSQQRVVHDQIRVLVLQEFDDILPTLESAVFVLHRKEFQLSIAKRVPIVRKTRVRRGVLLVVREQINLDPERS